MKRSGERKRLCGSLSGRLTVARTPATAGAAATVETRIVGACAATQIRQWVALGPVSAVSGCVWITAALDANTIRTRHSAVVSRCRPVAGTRSLRARLENLMANVY